MTTDNKRNAKCTKTYITADGKRLAKSADTITGVEFAFADGSVFAVFPGAATDQALATVAKGATVHTGGDFPASYLGAFAVRGVAENFGNAYASSKDVADAVAKFVSYRDNLLEGNWGEPREAEPSGLLLDACVAFAVSQGKDATKARETFTARLFEKDGDGKLTEGAKTLRKQYKAHAGIDAQFKRLQAEAATKAAKEAAKKAGTATADDIDPLADVA